MHWGKADPRAMYDINWVVKFLWDKRALFRQREVTVEQLDRNIKLFSQRYKSVGCPDRQHMFDELVRNGFVEAQGNGWVSLKHGYDKIRVTKQ